MVILRFPYRGHDFMFVDTEGRLGIFLSPRGYVEGQSLCGGTARNVSKSQNLNGEGKLRIFICPRVYMGRKTGKFFKSQRLYIGGKLRFSPSPKPI